MMKRTSAKHAWLFVLCLALPIFAAAKDGNTNLIIAYTADPAVTNEQHGDEDVPFFLLDGRWRGAQDFSVQYDGDVVIVAELKAKSSVKKISLMGYSMGNFQIESVAISVGDDKKSWKKVADLQNTNPPQTSVKAPALEFSAEVNDQLRYIKFEVKRKKGSMRLLIGEIIAEAGTTVFSQGNKESINIITDGKSDYAIVVPDADPRGRIKKASDLLQTMLKAATGVELPVVAESALKPGKPAIFLGKTRAAVAAELPLDTLKGWSHIKRAHQDGTLFLVGTDESCGIKGARYREYLGTLKAVVSFLEDEAGFRFILPGPNGVFIPKRNTLAVDANLKVDASPLIRYCEGSSGDLVYDIANDQFATSIYKSYGGHSYYTAVPSAMFGTTHPEYFALVNGVRDPSKDHLCISNPTVQELMLDEMEYWLNLGYEWIQLAQTDGYQACQCDACKAIHPDEGERLWIVHRKLAEEMKKRCPGKKVVILSYGPTAPVPKSFDRFPDNVIIELCNYEQWQFDRWRKYADEFLVYIYNWGTYNATGFGPKVTPHFVGVQVRLFLENNVRAIYKCGYGENMGLEGPTYYVWGRMLQDPKRDPDTLADEFYRLAYGGAYAPMKMFFDQLYGKLKYFGELKGRVREEQLKKFYNAAYVPANDPLPLYRPDLIYPEIFPPELLTILEDNLKKAATLETGPVIVARIRLVEREFAYVKNLANIFNYHKQYKEQSDLMVYTALLDEIDRRNILLDSWYKDGKMIVHDDWPSFLENPDKQFLKTGGSMSAILRAPVTWDTRALRTAKATDKAFEKKSMKVKRLAAAPVMNVTADEDLWKKLAPVNVGGIRGEAVTCPASFRIAYDAENVYFYFENFLSKNEAAPDNHKDVIFILLDTSGERRKFCRFTIGVKLYETLRFGYIDDTIDPLYGKEDFGWKVNAPRSIAVDVAKGRWLCEIQIPFKILGCPAPKPGTKWTMNAGHEYSLPKDAADKDVTEISTWSPNPASNNFSDLSAFGEITFE